MKTNDFFAKVDRGSSLAMELSVNSDSVLIAFGGIYGAMGIPPFEFFNLTKDIEINKIYIRDPYQSWYQKGLLDVTSSIDDTVGFLSKKLSQNGIRKVVMVGNSMGGFAAILFGVLMPEKVVVHAFAPQTFINTFNRWFYSDTRWEEQVNVLYREKVSSKYYDLKKILRKSRKKEILIHVYYSLCDRLDSIHAERVKKCKNIVLHSCRTGGHEIVKDLRGKGELQKIIMDSCLCC